jgi:alanine dehydrogenase
MGAYVTLLDTDLDKLRMSFWRYDNRVRGLASSKLAIAEQVRAADMVIGAVLIPGAAAPKLAVPNTSTYALTNTTLPYVVALADKGWERACAEDPSLALGLNAHAGNLTNAAVAAAHELGVHAVV